MNSDTVRDPARVEMNLPDGHSAPLPAAPPFARLAPAVAADLAVRPDQGLTDAEAAHRLAASGPNELDAPHRASVLASIWEAATEPFILMLTAAGVLAVILGETRDGALILVALVPIIGADVVTSFRAERALDALRAASAPTARVRRSGRPVDIAAAAVVPGDILLLTSGDVVAADARVLANHGALLDRAALTGESLPEPISVEPDAIDSLLAERHSVVYAGTNVVAGAAEAVVVATGRHTEVGEISSTLRPQEGRRRSPVQSELDRLVRILLIAATALVVITVGLGFLRGNPAGENLLAGITAAIAAIPEEPPVLLAVVLGLGAYRLLRRDVLVRRLNAQETLGAVDLILTDKTGTLTRNQLEVVAVSTPDAAMLAGPDRLAVLADAWRAEADAWRSDALGHSGAFLQAIRRAIGEDGGEGGPPELASDDLLSCEEPADGHPYSLVTYRSADGAPRLLASGAPEAILGLSREPEEHEAMRWRELISAEAAIGGRLLLLAARQDGEPWRLEALLTFADPLRPDISDAVSMAHGAGIQTLMVTGDHPITAAAIARSAGMNADHVVSGRDLASWDEARLAGELSSLNVVARATPSDKLRLVEAARRGNRTVAVTGDGVNDAPALQRADVAVAMGSGTAVAREAADLVLGDDSFATLMGGLREGRRIVANIQKGLVFLLSTHVALLGFLLVATIVGYGQPLLPIQVLWAELFIDISTSVAFEREPEEPGAMRQPPRPRSEPLLDDRLLSGIGLAGSFTVIAALGLMVTASGSSEHARWLAFTALAVGQAVRAYANRSLVMPVTRLQVNRFLAAAVVVVIVVQLIIPYVPALATAFQASPLSAMEWTLVAVVALLPAVIAQVARLLGRRWIA